MKIEFCCEAMESLFFDEQLEIQHENKEVWLETDSAYSGFSYCPNCGARIEITVKEQT